MSLEYVVCRIMIPYPFEWGVPTFDVGHAFTMMAAVLVSLIEVLYIHKMTIRLKSKLLIVFKQCIVQSRNPKH